MTTYNEIAGNLVQQRTGRGIQECSQAAMSSRTQIHIGYGICGGLVEGWLRSRKAKVDFWKMSGSENTTPLLGEHNTMQHASNIQALDSWDALKTELGKSSISFTLEHRYTTGVRGNANTIAGRVMGDAENFYVLSWAGEEANGVIPRHETAFHRPWQWFGYSETARFFDPNYGEFEVNKQGILSVLTDIGIDYKLMASSCTLRKFKG